MMTKELLTTDNGTVVKVLEKLNTVWLINPNGLRIRIKARPECWEVTQFGNIELHTEK